MKSLLIKLLLSLLIVIFIPLPTLSFFTAQCHQEENLINNGTQLGIITSCPNNIKRTAQYGLETFQNFLTRNDSRPLNVNIYESWTFMAIASGVAFIIVFILLSIIEFIWKKIGKAGVTSKV